MVEILSREGEVSWTSFCDGKLATSFPSSGMIIRTSVLSADMRLRADQCRCTGESLLLPMNCIFNILGYLNCVEKRDTVPTIGESNTLSTRQNNFALNCAESRLFINFCSQDPWRYYCNNLGHLSINQSPDPEHKAQCDGELTILFSEAK